MGPRGVAEPELLWVAPEHLELVEDVEVRRYWHREVVREAQERVDVPADVFQHVEAPPQRYVLAQMERVVHVVEHVATDVGLCDVRGEVVRPEVAHDVEEALLIVRVRDVRVAEPPQALERIDRKRPSHTTLLHSGLLLALGGVVHVVLNLPDQLLQRPIRIQHTKPQ